MQLCFSVYIVLTVNVRVAESKVEGSRQLDFFERVGKLVKQAASHRFNNKLLVFTCTGKLTELE